MGDPEIYTDEKVLVRTPGVYVKSIPFEGILTTKRIVLVDRAKNLLPPKEIPLATIKSVEAGENAIRDQILTLSVMAKTGDTRQMILTFSRQEGGNRKKERDEWLRHIQANVGASFENVIRKVIPAADAAPRKAEPPAQPRISIISSPAKPAVQPPAAPPAPAERAEIHPITNIIDAGKTTAAVPKTVTPVPDQAVFCSRCGNKVPIDSAFCNRCGSPIVSPAATPQTAPVVPTAPSTPAVQPEVDQAPQSVRPIDRDIGSIEPLIERSKDKVPADPLRKPVPEVPVQTAVSWEEDETESELPAFPVIAPPAPPAAAPAPAAPAAPAEKKGFLPTLFSPKAKTAASPSPAVPPVAPPPVPPSRRRGGFTPSRNMLLGIGVVVVILIIVAVGAIVVLPMLSGGETAAPSGGDSSSSSAPTSGSASTINPSDTIVIKETQAPVIPVTGVYVHVSYLGGFKGSYGMPDAITTVPGNSGDRIWEVEDASGTVVAEFEKLDGSAHELLVEIYKDGLPMSSGSTTVGHGSVKLSVDTTTGVALDPVTSG